MFDNQYNPDDERAASNQPNMPQAALWYAAHGYRVFPLLERDKRPRIKEWEHRATTHEQTIRQWWSTWPNANIAVATGAESKVFVLDQDDGDVGANELRLAGAMPNDIPHVVTGDGQHLWFFHPGGTVQNRVKEQGSWPYKHLDLRGDGGYVVAPPSLHPNGTRYAWADNAWPEGELPSAPTWLLAAVRKQRRLETNEDASDQPEPDEEMGKKIVKWAIGKVREDGQPRNHTGFEMACQLRDARFDQNTARHFMAHYQRAVEHDKPDQDDYTWSEALKSLGQAFKEQPRDPAFKSKSGRDKLSHKLFALARKRVRVFKGDDGELYLAERARGIEAFPIKSTHTRQWLNRLYREEVQNVPPSGQAIAETLEALEADAAIAGVYPVRVRLAPLPDGTALLDLANEEGHVVEVTADGWRVLDAGYWTERAVPVYFVRPKDALPLPMPDAEGTITDARTALAAVGDEQWPLVASYLLHCFMHGGDYWVMVLCGEQGSAKTYIAEAMRTLIDPARVRSSGPPRDEDALAVHANTSGIVCYDNLSAVPEWLSDALCRLSTGSGIIKRGLYTNFESAGWYGQRPTILTTITDIVQAGDLLDRSLIVPLKPIPADRYRSKEAVWAEFDALHAKALGGILTALAGVLRELPEVRRAYTGKLPRMTDATLYGLALERVAGWSQGDFIDGYANNRQDAMGSQLEGSRVATYIAKLVEANRGSWQGTTTDLLQALNDELTNDYGQEADWIRRQRDWPTAPNQLSAMLNRLAPALRSAGYTLDSRSVARGQPLQKIITSRGGQHA